MKKIWGIIGVMALAAVCVFLLSEAAGVYYYTQIDNSKIAAAEPDGGVVDFSGGMEFAYTLPSYDAHGKRKEMTFGTMRELKEGAFLRLKAVPVRGVVEWAEVQYGELPAAVQSQYAAKA